MATIADMGIASSYPGILQPKLKNRWRVTFTGIGGMAEARALTMQATKVDRPKLEFEEVDLHRYNSRAWVASKHNWSDCSMTVEDDISSQATSIIQAQVQRQQWLIGSMGPWLGTAPEGSIYKYGTKIEMLDGGENVLEVWNLEGCWLKNVDYADVNYAEGSKMEISLVVRFDHAYQVIMPYTTGPGSALGGPSF